jgi:hypothetical protein
MKKKDNPSLPPFRKGGQGGFEGYFLLSFRNTRYSHRDRREDV